MRFFRSPLTCVALSPDGTKFAAGSQDGHLYYTDVEERSLVRLKYTEDAIISIVFSPNGEHLAFGAKDDTIYYIQDASRTLPDNPEEPVKLTGHSSHVQHLDFAQDNVHLRSNSADLELLFWNNEGQVTDPEVIDSLIWPSQNCTLTFDTMGIWPSRADGTDINNCQVYQDIIAVGDDFGRIRIYKFPTNQVKAEFNELVGHADHVKNVAFTADGQLVSAGGLEGSLFQWKK